MQENSDCVVFVTAGGNEYVYNSRTNSVLPAGIAHEAASEQEKPEAAFLFNQYERCEDEYLATLSRRALGVRLVVTEACNQRCGYCTYSEHYPLMRNHGTRAMDVRTAKQAISYLFRVFRRPDRSVRQFLPDDTWISFYGGEPLLEYDLIRECVRYAKSLGPCRFTMTTNGALLSRSRVDFFIDNGFKIAVSLDGPREEHDRNRVFASGGGTFTTVMEKLAYLRDHYSEYLRDQMSFLVTLDPRTDLAAVAAFFDGEFPGTAVRWNPVRSDNTTYFEQFSETEVEVEAKRRQETRRQYEEMLGACPVPVRWSAYHHLHRSFETTYLDRIRCQRTMCPIGSRMTVHPDGTLHMCERISPSFPIGDVSVGLDYPRIRALATQFKEDVVERNGCDSCVARWFCGVCYALCDGGGRFCRSQGSCSRLRKSLKSSLARVYSLVERNPGVYSWVRNGGGSACFLDRVL